MKSILTAALLSFIICSCSVQKKITSIEYVPKTVNFVSSGVQSPEKNRLLLVCYNKHFNQERFSTDFLIKNKLNAINYGQNMLVEIFLGERKNEILNLSVDKIEENNDSMKVYYSFDEGNDSKGETPYIFVSTEKSRKPVLFIENGKAIKMSPSDLYIIN